ncbi:MAG: S9 family peptidase [Cyclobacteriaceae bacterium]
MRQYLILSLLFLSQISWSQNKTITIEDLNRLVNISDVEISPDATSVLFMTSRRNMEKNSYDRSLVLMDIQSKKQETVGGSLSGISSPTWTPDGTGISLIAGSENGRQVQILNPKSGAVKVVTQSKTGVNRYAWSPDGKTLAYLARQEKPEKDEAEKFNDSFEVGNGDYLTSTPPLNTAVWTIGADGSNPQQITSDNFTVATGLVTSALSWSPDGKSIAFTGFPSAFPGDSDLGKNYVYNVTTKQLKKVTDSPNNESSPLFTPDNQNLWYSYPRDGVPANVDDWYSVNLKTGAKQNMTASLDRLTYTVKWLADGGVLFSGIDNLGNAIWKLNNGKFTKIELGSLTRVFYWSISKSGSMVLYATTKDAAGEIYYKSKLTDKPVALTEFNKFVSELNLGRQESFEWESSDGLHPNGVITYPPDFDPSKKYPLVLDIHGGPTASSLLGFSVFPQLLAAKGWIVFEPNYRGSNNLGNKFQSAIAKDPSEGPGHDVFTGLQILKARPYVSNNQIGVSGWSYGGWMTSWLIGRYPDEWAAAVSGASPVDFTDMYSLNDLNRMRRHAIVESPYSGNNIEWAYKNSPIWNFNHVKVPTLIMSKTGDTRVTITGSYKLYGALRDNNVPVQFIAYPGGDHFPRDPVRANDVYERWIGWLDKYLTRENTVGGDNKIIKNDKP